MIQIEKKYTNKTKTELINFVILDLNIKSGGEAGCYQ